MALTKSESLGGGTPRLADRLLRKQCAKSSKPIDATTLYAPSSRSGALPSALTADWYRLEPIQRKHCLIPCAGKRPLVWSWSDPDHWDGVTVDDCINRTGCSSIGIRTSTNLLALDFDGPSSFDYALDEGINIWAPNWNTGIGSWQVHRTDEPFRLKILWEPTSEQIAQLPAGQFSSKHHTKDAEKLLMVMLSLKVKP